MSVLQLYQLRTGFTQHDDVQWKIILNSPAHLCQCFHDIVSESTLLIKKDQYLDCSFNFLWVLQ